MNNELKYTVKRNDAKIVKRSKMMHDATKWADPNSNYEYYALRVGGIPAGGGAAVMLTVMVSITAYMCT